MLKRKVEYPYAVFKVREIIVANPQKKAYHKHGKKVINLRFKNRGTEAAMKIDLKKVEEIVRGITPIFLDHHRAEQVTVKGVADFVTAADFAVQRHIQESLGNLYPDVQFMGEEKDNSEIDFSGDVWILDPVDGTTNLIHDYRQSALSLGYLEGGVLSAGVIFQPQSGEMYTAALGQGAFLNGRPIHVSTAGKMSESLISIGTSPYRKDLAGENFALFQRIFEDAEDVRRSGSAALDMAYVAAGRTEGYLERFLKPWDIAAGTILVREAGGCVVTFDGKEPDFSKPQDIVCGNGKIDKLLREEYLGQ